MTGVIVAWLTEVVLITYRGTKKGSPQNVGGLPLPADYLATFAIFGVLGLFSGVAEKPATVAAWGYVAATFLNLFDPTLNKPGASVTNTSTGTVATNPSNPSTYASSSPTVARPPTATNVSIGG
jgi:hypothetical protein